MYTCTHLCKHNLLNLFNVTCMHVFKDDHFFSLFCACVSVSVCICPHLLQRCWVLAFHNMGHKWCLEYNLDFWFLLVHKLPSHCRSTGLMDVCYWIQLFMSSGIGTQGLMLARDTFSALSYLPSLDWVWEEVPSTRHFPAIKHSTCHQIHAITDRLWQEACYW